MKVLITGSNGFIGKNISNKDWEITRMTRNDSFSNIGKHDYVIHIAACP